MVKTRKALEAELAAAQENAKDALRRLAEMRNERDGARDDAKLARDQFADLKKRLLDAETETARLRGYLDRVHEDDVVRDGMVEIEDERGKRQVPRRQPPMMRAYAEGPEMFMGTDPYGRQRKQTHWTSY